MSSEGKSGEDGGSEDGGSARGTLPGEGVGGRFNVGDVVGADGIPVDREVVAELGAHSVHTKADISEVSALVALQEARANMGDVSGCLVGDQGWIVDRGL